MTSQVLSEKEFGTLIKCVGMTGSSQDGEALAAIRKANGILMKRNLTWEQLLRGSVDVQQKQPDPEPSDHFDGEIDRMFTFLMQTVQGSFRSFITSVHDQWEAEHWVSDKQYDALRNAYLRGKRSQRYR